MSSDRPPLITVLERESGSHPAIRLSRSSSGLHKSIGSPASSPGWMISEGQIHEWRWTGLAEHGGWLYITFPRIKKNRQQELNTLDSIFSGPPSRVIRNLRTLLHYLLMLQADEGPEAGAFYIDSVFIDESMRFYFLHPVLGEILNRESAPEYLPPGIKGTDELIYRSLRRLHRVLIANSAKQEEATSLQKKPPAVHPHEYLPSLQRNIADTLYTVLVLERVPTLESFFSMIDGWAEESPFEEIGSSEKEKRVREARSVTRKAHRRLGLVSFRKKHGTTVLVTIAILIGAVFIATPFIRTALEPDKTEGLSRMEVIRLFYDSQNRLDHETMQECVTGNAGKIYLNQVTTLFVISRVREGVEQESFFNNAPDWIEAGRPPLPDGHFVFGLTDLVISPVEETDRFRVEYIRWTTLSSELPEEGVDEEPGAIAPSEQVEAEQVIEEVHLTETKHGWKIDSIEPVKSVPVTKDR